MASDAIAMGSNPVGCTKNAPQRSACGVFLCYKRRNICSEQMGKKRQNKPDNTERNRLQSIADDMLAGIQVFKQAEDFLTNILTIFILLTVHFMNVIMRKMVLHGLIVITKKTVFMRSNILINTDWEEFGGSSKHTETISSKRVAIFNFSDNMQTYFIKDPCISWVEYFRISQSCSRFLSHSRS